MNRAARTALIAALPFLAAASPAGQSPWLQKNDAAMARMHAGMMAVPPAASADQAFVDGMLPHHQAAVDMAKTELRYGHDPELLRLARDIIAAQDREIVQMRAWSAKHPSEHAPADAAAPMRMGHG